MERRLIGRSSGKSDRLSRHNLKENTLGQAFLKQYRRRTGFIWTEWFTAYFINYILMTWLPTLYVRIGHLPAVMALKITAITGGSMIVGQYVLTFLIDWIGRKTFSLVGYSLSLIGLIYGIIATFVYHNVHWTVLFITAEFAFIGTAWLCMLLWTYTPELYPTRMRGWATSATTGMRALPVIIGTFVVGLVLAVYHIEYMALGYVFVLLAVMSVVGLIVIGTFGIETKKKTLELLSP